MIIRVQKSILLIPLAFLIVGCGTSEVSSIHGSITYNGQPLQYGAITLSSTDGSTANFGGVVSDGLYKVDNIVPGEFKVTIIAGVKHDGARVASSDDGRMLAEKGEQNNAPIQIPSNASGNNQLVLIKLGEHAFDFTLKSPESQ